MDELYILTYPKGAEKDRMYWLFVVADSETGLIVAYKVAPNKQGYDPTKLLYESVSIARKEPKIMASDSLDGYKKTISKALPNAVHISDTGINGVHINNKHERLNGELKDNIGRARGYKSETPPRVKLQIIYHNFIHKTAGSIPTTLAAISVMAATHSRY